MQYKAAVIVAVCVLGFYVVLLTAMGIYWIRNRLKRRQEFKEMEAQAAAYNETVFSRTEDGQPRPGPSRTASMFSETRSVRSMFYEGPGRRPSSDQLGLNYSNSDSSDRRYSSVHSNLIPLQETRAHDHFDHQGYEDDLADLGDGLREEGLSAYSTRSRASTASTIRYYAEGQVDGPPVTMARTVLTAAT